MGREPFATLGDVAEYYNVSPQTIYNWRSQGKGPRANKIGGQLRFDWREVEEWARAGGATVGGDARSAA